MPSTYADEAPIFALSAKLKGTTLTADTSPLLLVCYLNVDLLVICTCNRRQTWTKISKQDLEEAVNVHCPEAIETKHRAHTISIQLQYLLSRFDVMLETDCARMGNRDYGRDHLFIRASRGHDRQLPLSFNNTLNSFSFDWSDLLYFDNKFCYRAIVVVEDYQCVRFHYWHFLLILIWCYLRLFKMNSLRCILPGATAASHSKLAMLAIAQWVPLHFFVLISDIFNCWHKF